MKLIIAIVLAALTASAGIIKHNRAKQVPVQDPERVSRANVARDLCAQNVLDKGGDQAAVTKECGAE